MKSRLPYTLLALAVGLLLGGLLLGRVFVAPAPVSSLDRGFRQFFWSERTLDLMAQVALVFAGVLGVLALLREEEVTESEGDDGT